MLFSATFRCYEELNDFLPESKQKVAFRHYFAKGATVKDIIESFGIPHTEVDLILVNSISVDFSYQVQNDDYISVYPMFEAIDIHPIIRLRPKPLRLTRFIADDHLGKLTKYLRLLGFDTLLAKTETDSEIIAVANKEHRIILTRDVKLLKRKAVTHGHYIRATHPKMQAAEVLIRFDLTHQLTPFTRCLLCNGLIEKVINIKSIENKIPMGVLQIQKNFYQCNHCQHIYWHGTHYEKLAQWVQQCSASQS